MTGTIILFLDFDGVLHPQHIGVQYFCRTEFLWQILRACPEVRVVFSTSWRESHRPEELLDFATSGGGEDLAHRFIGQTPRIHAHSDFDPRGLECHRWLEANCYSGQAWLALDDVPELFHRMFHQNLYLVDGYTGLTETDVAAIIRRLRA